MRVMIAEDNVLLREGLVRLLTEYEIEVVGTSGDAE
jgi:DNA-binding NarL/FixJ family response regulator